tara:strand:- start:29 stop:190 length:162 start_codon:yes stop_codon:yes gene_type:complete
MTNLHNKGIVISIPYGLSKSERKKYVKSKKFQNELQNAATSIFEQWHTRTRRL